MGIIFFSLFSSPKKNNVILISLRSVLGYYFLEITVDKLLLIAVVRVALIDQTH